MATPAKSMIFTARAPVLMRYRIHWLALPALCAMLACGLALFVLARPYREQIDIGGLLDHAFVRDFYATEHGDGNVTFRWSKPEATLLLPGAGAQAPLSLRLHGDYPGMTVRLDAGYGPITVPLRNGWQSISLVPRADRWSGDVSIAIRAPTQKSADDPRVRGVAVAEVELHGVGGSAPLGQALLLAFSTLLVALLAQRATAQRWIGALLGLVAAFGGATLLAQHGGAQRLMLTSYTERLALALVLGGLLLLALEWALQQLARRGVLAFSLATQRGLAGAAVLAFLVRYGAMIYPLNFVSDLRFSMQRATMVRDGQFLTLFLPNPALTPTQWALDGPIPRSPFYYLVTAPLMFLPDDAAPLAIMAFSAVVDAVAALLVAVIARKIGASQRASLCATLLAGITPLGVQMIMSWGIFPTLLAQCLLLFAMVVWLYQRAQLHTRRGWLMFGAALALAYVSYPTALLFGGLLWLALLALLAVRREPATGGTFKAGIFAAATALMLFYGWHVPVLVERTLPKFLARFGGTAASSSGSTTDATVRDSHTFREVLNTLWNPLYGHYGALIIGLAIGGALLLAFQRWRAPTGGRTLLAAWWIVYVPLGLMNGYVITFILKHIVFMLPALAILGGLLLGRIAQWRWGVLVVAALLGLVLWQTFAMETDAVINAFRQLK